MFGLTGSHRTGKTTLAKALAKRNGIFFFQSSTTEIMREGGFDPVSDMSVEQRIDAQEWLLLRYMEMQDGLPQPFITDRTPLDFAAYMLAEVAMHNTSAELGERIDLFARTAVLSAASMFDTIMVARPLPSYEQLPDKPPLNVGYQSHIQTLIEGMAYQMLSERVTVGFLTATDHEARLTACTNLIKRRMDDFDIQKSASLIH